MNIYSLIETDMDEGDFIVDDYQMNVKKTKVYNGKQNPKVLLTFLNNGLRNIMNKLNYVEIGRTNKYFNTAQRS